MRPSLSIITIAVTAVLALSSFLAAASSVPDLHAVVAPSEVAAFEAVHYDKVLETRKKHSKSRKSGAYGKATWYAGSQMNAPICGGSKPSDSDMVTAVASSSSFKCNEWITLTKGRKSVKVKVVDFCESCSMSPMHFDLSKGAFKKLASLNDGEVRGLSYWKS